MCLLCCVNCFAGLGSSLGSSNVPYSGLSGSDKGLQAAWSSLQVWVVPEVREGKVYWRADSDSALTKARARWVGGVASTRLQLEMSPIL